MPTSLSIAAVRARALRRGYRLSSSRSSEDAYRLYARDGNHLVLGGEHGVGLDIVTEYLNEQL